MAAIYLRSSFYKKWLPLGLVVCILLSMTLSYRKYNQLTLNLPAHRQSMNGVDRETYNRGVIMKVRVTNNPIFVASAPDHMLEPRQASLQLDKLIERKQPPQNKFQWLYKDTTTLIYSAHYDSQDSVIKLVGFKHRFNISMFEELVLCRYPNGETVAMETLYNVSVMSPRPGLEYNTWIWRCKYKEHPPPRYLSLITQTKQTLIDRISIIYHPFADGAEKVRQPIICVKPMVKGYNDSYQLIEFLETSRLWGVSKVVLYPNTIDEKVILPILNKYKREGLIDVHEWRPPVPEVSLHAFGQKSHNQHCLYTYMYRYQWAAFIDLDELIVAGGDIMSLESMIQAGLAAIEESSTQAHVAGFVLRSQMCSITLPNDPLYSTTGGDNLCKITSMRKTNCTPPMQPGVWSKPLVNTDGTEIVDIHTVRLPRPEHTIIDLDPTIGTVRHYRALKRTSVVLAQSAEYNILMRNTHKFMKQAKEKMRDICAYNNPSIGVIKYAD